MSWLAIPSGPGGEHHILIRALQVTAAEPSICRGCPSGRWKSKTTGPAARTSKREWRPHNYLKTLSIIGIYATLIAPVDRRGNTRCRNEGAMPDYAVGLHSVVLDFIRRGQSAQQAVDRILAPEIIYLPT